MTCEHKTIRELSFCLSQVQGDPEFICLIPDISTMRRKSSPNFMSGEKGGGLGGGDWGGESGGRWGTRKWRKKV